jgi:hypothetical protein
MMVNTPFFISPAYSVPRMTSRGAQGEADAGVAGHALGVGVGGELAGVEDHVVGLAEAGQLVGGGADEHVAHKEGVVGAAADDADLDAVLGIPAREAVHDVEALAGAEVVDGALAVDEEAVLGLGDVDGAPPDLALAESGCSTMRLSLGLRPVLAPESATIAPALEMAVPGSFWRASS